MSPEQQLICDLQCFLDRVTYKPNWKFRIKTEPARLYAPWYIEIHLDYEAPSIHNPAEMQQLTTMCNYSAAEFLSTAVRNDYLMDAVVKRLIMRAEHHEIDEWLKLDGVCVREPHPESRPK